MTTKNLNTRLDYLYRDASNYKKYTSCIIKGQFTEKQKKEILDTLSVGEYFIPEQVGLPANRFEDFTEDDHPFCEISDEDIYETLQNPTVNMTAEELYENFMRVKATGWDITMRPVNEEEKADSSDDKNMVWTSYTVDVYLDRSKLPELEELIDDFEYRISEAGHDVCGSYFQEGEDGLLIPR